MNSSHPIRSTLLDKWWLILLALTGSGLILFATSIRGAGLSTDSVVYISTARNMMIDYRYLFSSDYNLTVWPPLYPALLALVGTMVGSDPLSIVHIFNALLFGLVIYSGGLLIIDYFAPSKVLVTVGVILITVSQVQLGVFVMVWSESLFICLLALSIVFARSLIVEQKIAWLFLFAVAVSLAALTRYVGIILILWGVVIILIHYPSNLKQKLVNASVFGIIAVLPIGLWILRNYVLSGTFFGERSPTVFTLGQNIFSTFVTILSWYIPVFVVSLHPALIALSLLFSLVVGLRLRTIWKTVPIGLRDVSPLIILVTLYIVFLIASSSSVAIDQLGHRLLIPVYIPITVLYLLVIQMLVKPRKQRISNKLVNTAMLIIIPLSIVYSLQVNLMTVMDIRENGLGLNHRRWTESEIIHYLISHPGLETECTLYSNQPPAIYLLSNVTATFIPAKQGYNSSAPARDILSLMGKWPEENDACLIWFDSVDHKHLYTLDELREIAEFDLLVHLDDGAIFSITRK